ILTQGRGGSRLPAEPSGGRPVRRGAVPALEFPAPPAHNTALTPERGGVMRIVELTAFQVRIPLRRPFRHASHTRTSTDNVRVRCVLEDKTEGFGEGVPREYVTGETADSALDLLGRSDLATQLGPCRDFREAVALAERLRLAPVAGDERGCQGNAARCA